MKISPGGASLGDYFVAPRAWAFCNAYVFKIRRRVARVRDREPAIIGGRLFRLSETPVPLGQPEERRGQGRLGFVRREVVPDCLAIGPSPIRAEPRAIKAEA